MVEDPHAVFSESTAGLAGNIEQVRGGGSGEFSMYASSSHVPFAPRASYGLNVGQHRRPPVAFTQKVAVDSGSVRKHRGSRRYMHDRGTIWCDDVHTISPSLHVEHGPFGETRR